MKKASLLFVVLVLTPLTLIAQNGPLSVSINVTADVQASVEMITIRSMDFQNTDRDAMIVILDPLQSPAAGQMVARGNPNAEFRVDYLQNRELTNTQGPGVLIFNYDVAGNSVDEQETAELLGQDIRDLQFNDQGEFYIWVGGRVDLTDATPGSYEGEFSIEIEYI